MCQFNKNGVNHVVIELYKDSCEAGHLGYCDCCCLFCSCRRRGLVREYNLRSLVDSTNQCVLNGLYQDCLIVAYVGWIDRPPQLSERFVQYSAITWQRHWSVKLRSLLANDKLLFFQCAISCRFKIDKRLLKTWYHIQRKRTFQCVTMWFVNTLVCKPLQNNQTGFWIVMSWIQALD